MEYNQIIQGDCVEVMQEIKDKSIDMILCDLPYGTTACKWDIIIPFEPLWKQYKRIIKDNGAIVLTASQPFTSALVMSNIKMFKYELIWDKNYGGSPGTAKYRPMPSHESILIFGKNKLVYNPQMKIGKPYTDKRYITKPKKLNINKNEHKFGYINNVGAINKGTRFPLSVIKIQRHNTRGQHPTQKPVPLFEYLIKTYTNKGDLVLDNCAGSFTTAIAAENLKRNWICIEKEKSYCNIGWKRINENRIKLNSNLFEGFNLPLLDNCDIL